MGTFLTSFDIRLNYCLTAFPLDPIVVSPAFVPE